MTRRTKIIIGAVIVIVIIIVIILLLSFFRSGPVEGPDITNQPLTNTGLPEVGPGEPLGISVPLSIVNPPEVKTTAEKRETDLVRMAMPFVERFGSYSNHSNYKNIEELMIYMSKDMKAWAEDHIKKNRSSKQDTSIYFGLTTEALSAQVENFDNEVGSAKIKVSSQRKESSGSASNAKLYYQDILVSFVRESGAWKVDSAYWQ